MATKEATVIYDLVSWAEDKGRDSAGRLVQLFHSASRGETVTLPADEYDRLADAKTHPPYGAVAEPGSEVAVHLSRPISGAEDPAAVRARLAAIKVDGPSVAVMLDPSGRNSDWEATEIDPGVQRSRASAPLTEAAGSGAAGSIPQAALDALDKAGVAKMAKALGVEVGSKDTKDEIVAKLRAHLAGDAAATGETEGEFASGGPSGAVGANETPPAGDD